MKHIGLTGGIGAGKSTVAKIFARCGATVIDADAVAREVMGPGSDTLAKVADALGDDILTTDGHLERARLAEIIFADRSAREKLNAIVHPAVRYRSAQLVREAQMNPNFSGVVVEDIPLLVETGQAGRFDAVAVVYADRASRVRRLMERRKMTEADALARIEAQASDEQRAAIATWVIDNSGDLEQTKVQAARVWAEISEQLTG